MALKTPCFLVINMFNIRPANLVTIYKYISKIISPVLFILINKSVSVGKFSASLKNARVVSLYNEGDRCMTSNYRPISIWPTLSKIFERAVHQQLYRYFEFKGVFFPNQFGYRSKISL